MNVRIHYGDEAALCSVRETPSVTTRIRIHVYPDGRVEIEAPAGKTREQIQKAAQRRARWVFEHRSAALQARELATRREYVSGETHFYLGRRHKLIVTATPQKTSSVKLMRGRIEVVVPVADPAAVRRRLNEWYRQRADDYFSRKLSEWSSSLPWVRSQPEMRLISMKTQWGSCSPEGRVHLNPALIRAPRHCIEYVVLHELCHLVEHNHSKKFYTLLDRHMPQWSQAKSELDGLAELILADR
ncbi:MAG: M48 family metallopeptidase [Oceanicaulis sp.]|nr:M48 family metallopeptidase [Oceanicaulis sp.]